MRTFADDDRAPVTGVVLSRNNKVLMGKSLDGKIRIWEIKSGEVLKWFQGSHLNSR